MLGTHPEAIDRSRRFVLLGGVVLILAVTFVVLGAFGWLARGFSDRASSRLT